MKTIAIAIILGVVAHAAVGFFMESKTVKNIQKYNSKIELAKGALLCLK